MASEYLKQTIQGYENYIKQSGIDDKVIGAYIDASKTAYLNEKDTEYGLKISKRSKELIEQYVLSLAKMSIWDLDSLANQTKKNYQIGFGRCNQRNQYVRVAGYTGARARPGGKYGLVYSG